MIQYIYRRYGRERAGLAATVITYRGRSARARGGQGHGPVGRRDRGAGRHRLGPHAASEMHDGRLKEVGLDPDDPLLAARHRAGAASCSGFPRHLSQHVGGFVLTKGRLDETVPIGNAAMEDRTVIEWDKDDIDALGILKVDVLAPRHAHLHPQGARPARAPGTASATTLASVPREDEAVYDMLCKADSIGVFQVESRAQMNMLPRLQAALLLRSRHRGGDRPARPDPGRHGASLSAPPRRAGARDLSGTPSRLRAGGRAAPGAGPHPGRAAVPGTGDEARHGGGRVHAGRG